MFRGNPRVSRERRNSRRVTPIATNPPRSRSRHAGLGVCAALALAGRSVIAGSFALPRDADQRSAFQAVPAAAPRRRCRATTGGLPRGRRSAVVRHAALEGTGREGSHPDGWGVRRRGPAGRCADQRSAFQAIRALLLLRVRAEKGAIPTVGACPAAALRAAVPAGGRRSKPSARLFSVGWTR